MEAEEKKIVDALETLEQRMLEDYSDGNSNSRHASPMPDWRSAIGSENAGGRNAKEQEM